MHWKIDLKKKEEEAGSGDSDTPTYQQMLSTSSINGRLKSIFSPLAGDNMMTSLSKSTEATSGP